MTIGTPLWDEFVANLKEVKLTIEDMGFMPEHVPSEAELKSATPSRKAEIEAEFRKYYNCYALMSTKTINNDMYVKVDKVNEEVRNLYYCNYVNLDAILNKIGDDFLKYIINMSELCNVKKIKATYLDLLVKYGITAAGNAERYMGFLCTIGIEYIYCVNVLTDSFDSRVFNDSQKKEIKRRIVYSAKLLVDEYGKIPTVIDLDNNFKKKVELLRDEMQKHSLPTEFSKYFIAPFKGIGPQNNINYYGKLEKSLTDMNIERSPFEYAKIALLIYKSNKMSKVNKPKTFKDWYKYFCNVVGCKYDEEYKPSKLPISKKLEVEFSYLLD